MAHSRNTALHDLPLGAGVRVLESNRSGLIALEKPCGLSSHPNSSKAESTALLNAPYDETRQAYCLASGSRLHLLHRLDSATSGVILLSSHEELAQAVRDAFAGRAVKKLYQALVFGLSRGRRQQWRDRLQTLHEKGRIRSRVGEGVPADCDVTSLKVLHGQPLLSRLELRPLTGRSHQLRVQCQHHGLPIVGDTTYGDFKRNREFSRRTGRDRLFLHAESIEITLPWKGSRLEFSAHSPLPAEFDRPR